MSTPIYTVLPDLQLGADGTLTIGRTTITSQSFLDKLAPNPQSDAEAERDVRDLELIERASVVNWSQVFVDDGLVQHGPLRVRPDHPGLPGARVQIKSPCSDTVVSEYDPVTRCTTRRVCTEAVFFIASRTRWLDMSPHNPFFDNGVGDPLYFIAAGVEYKTLVTPFFGTVAYVDDIAIERFLKRFGREAMQNWLEDTGFPFPYRRFPGRTRRRRVAAADSEAGVPAGTAAE